MKTLDLNILANKIRENTKELIEYVFDCYGDEERLDEMINDSIETIQKSISTPIDMELIHIRNGIEMNVYDYLISFEILEMLNLDKENDDEIIDNLCDLLTNEIYDYFERTASKNDFVDTDDEELTKEETELKT